MPHRLQVESVSCIDWPAMLRIDRAMTSGWKGAIAWRTGDPKGNNKTLSEAGQRCGSAKMFPRETSTYTPAFVPLFSAGR